MTCDIVVFFWWSSYLSFRPMLRRHTRSIVLVFDQGSLELCHAAVAVGETCDLVMVSNKAFLALTTDCKALVRLCEDGVDTTLFSPAATPHSGRDVTFGWTGNSRAHLSYRSLNGFGAEADDYKGLWSIIRPAHAQLGMPSRLEIRDRSSGNVWPHEMMPEWYRGLDVYIVASIAEGTPNPALEAAASQVLLISNAVGVVPEIFTSGVDAFVIPREVSAYRDVMRWCIKNPEQASEMARAGREAVVASWDWSVKVDQYRKAFREVLGKKESA